MRVTIWIPFILLAAAACAPDSDMPDPAAAPAPDAVSSEEQCVVGLLTGDGVECPAMQSLQGDVFTLIGDLQGRGPGDMVCVCGRPVEMSTCMQGTTIELTRIGSPSICP